MKNISGIFSVIISATLIFAAGYSSAQTETQSTHDNVGGGTGTQVGAATVSPGTIKVPIYGLGFNVTSGSPVFSAVTFTTSGSYTSSDILNFKFWECNFDVFPSSTAVQRGSTITTGLGPGSHTFSSLGITIATGSFHCFYITVDISPAAAGGHTIIGNPITKANTIITGTNNYGTNLQGGTQTIAGSLPVELLSFSGKNSGKENHLEWTTASEINNDFFSVEKSMDGIHFDRIATVDGAGSSTSLHTYYYTDSFLSSLSALYYYRLRQTDYNGNSEYSDIILVRAAFQNKLPAPHFDPLSHILSVETYFEEDGEYFFNIVDVSGNAIFHNVQKATKGKNTFLLLLTSFSNGVHILNITGNNISLQSKFVINQ
jgi:hypothetical protein